MFLLEVTNFFLHFRFHFFKRLYMVFKCGDRLILITDFGHIFHPQAVSFAQSLFSFQVLLLKLKKLLFESIKLD